MSAPAANAFSLPVMIDHRDRRIGVERRERRAELVGERVVQRVQLLRTVEADEADALARLDDDVLVVHGVACDRSGATMIARRIHRIASGVDDAGTPIRRNRLARSARRDDSGPARQRARPAPSRSRPGRHHGAMSCPHALSRSASARSSRSRFRTASVAAEPAPSVTPIMERAFAFHEQGPDRLRQFVHRTRMIYGLRQDDVVNAYRGHTHGRRHRRALTTRA